MVNKFMGFAQIQVTLVNVALLQVDNAAAGGEQRK
jgi:hypothetical protein